MHTIISRPRTARQTRLFRSGGWLTAAVTRFFYAFGSSHAKGSWWGQAGLWNLEFDWGFEMNTWRFFSMCFGLFCFVRPFRVRVRMRPFVRMKESHLCAFWSAASLSKVVDFAFCFPAAWLVIYFAVSSRYYQYSYTKYYIVYGTYYSCPWEATEMDAGTLSGDIGDQNVF